MGKTCFVIAPIGDAGSEIRKRSDQVLHHIIEPAAVGYGYKVVRADFAVDDKTISESITQHVLNDALVIADLTGNNPNVLYELGKRHTWGGHCLHLTQDAFSELPFDMKFRRVIAYDLHNPDKLGDALSRLKGHIKHLQEVPPQLPFPLTPELVVRLSGETVLVTFGTGRRDHYYQARRILRDDSTRIFLMQRSSTLILGPEMDWGAEETFCHSLLEQIARGVKFYHIVSLEGIKRHVRRPQSIFPGITSARGKLAYGDQDTVGIQGRSQVWPFKRIPDAEEAEDLKPDRQARALLVEYEDGSTDGVLVVDLGGRQSFFHLRGSKMAEFLHSCLDFYSECPYLRGSEIVQILGAGG